MPPQEGILSASIPAQTGCCRRSTRDNASCSASRLLIPPVVTMPPYALLLLSFRWIDLLTRPASKLNVGRLRFTWAAFPESSPSGQRRRPGPTRLPLDDYPPARR